MEKPTELKVFIEKIVDKTVNKIKKQKLEEQKLLKEEQKKKLEEQKKIDEFKVNLHSILSPIDWSNLSIEESKLLVSKLEAFITKNK